MILDNEAVCTSVEEVIRKYNGMISRIAFHFVKHKEDTEDIAQETYIKWMTQKPSFHDAKHEKAWLIRITANLSKNHVATAWYRTTKSASVFPSAGISLSSKSDVLDEVLALPQKYRIVIYLYYYEGYQSDEIATILRKNPKTIRTQLARARSILKTKLGDDDDA